MIKYNITIPQRPGKSSKDTTKIEIKLIGIIIFKDDSNKFTAYKIHIDISTFLTTINNFFIIFHHYII